jgi:hypothetical protein
MPATAGTVQQLMTTGDNVNGTKSRIVLAFFSGCNQSQIFPRSGYKNNFLF